jgi:AraC family transcriptional regulator of adaptative response/methylated-DNA-[protein]-cysteine methyltransferase
MRYFKASKSTDMKANIVPFVPKEQIGSTISYSFADCPFARIVLASTDRGLCSVSLVDQTEAEAVARLKKSFPKAIFEASSRPEHEAFLTQFTGEPAPLTFHLLGTPFQLDVWKALLDIPLGGTSTYGSLAAQIGRPKAFRAVGSAVGDNPIFYAIPCHRVLPASGGVGNYFWGSEIKRKILVWEKAI